MPAACHKTVDVRKAGFLDFMGETASQPNNTPTMSLQILACILLAATALSCDISKPQPRRMQAEVPQETALLWCSAEEVEAAAQLVGPYGFTFRRYILTKR